MNPAEVRNQVTQIDFRGRDFTPDDVEQARQLVDFFRAQGKIPGDIDPQKVLLSGWFDQNTQ